MFTNKPKFIFSSTVIGKDRRQWLMPHLPPKKIPNSPNQNCKAFLKAG